MIIAVDGACKRNGQPTCTSVGTAWIQTDAGELLYKAKFETGSTNQRGEINGLLEALRFAVQGKYNDESVIIITDSEYLHDTIVYDRLKKWSSNNWTNSQGDVKNVDLWKQVQVLMQTIDNPFERVYMQWTKGHLLAYSAGNIKAAMKEDLNGIELYARVNAIAHRISEYTRVSTEFMRERTKHDKSTVPIETAIEWVVANTVADCLASHIVGMLDATYVV